MGIVTKDGYPLLYEEEPHRLRGMWMEIYNILGPGHKEVTYANAFEQLLQRDTILYEREKVLPVSLGGKHVGTYRPDFVIFDAIIVEFKSLEIVPRVFLKKVHQYLKASPFRLAFIVNFGTTELQITRRVYDSKRVPTAPQNSACNPQNSARAAFTLIEITLVSALIAILVAVSVPILTSLQTFSAIEAVHGPLLGDLRLAQFRAMTGEGVRGAYLQTDRYTLYVGTSYTTRDASRDRTVTLDAGVTMAFRGFAGGSGPLDVRFAAITGAPSDTGTIVITHATGRTQFLAIRPGGLMEETRSGTVVLTAEGDAALSESVPSTNVGTAVYLESYPWEPSNTRRSVLRFPLAAVPRGATVSAARLIAQTSQTYGAMRTIALHRVTKPWDERAVTWQSTGAEMWIAAGGDFIGTPTATATLAWGGTLPAATFTVTSDVQQMVNGAVANDGWLLKDASEDSSQAYWFFSSREGGTVPRLEVDYVF